MITNTDVTLFHRTIDKDTKLSEWEARYIPNVWWYKQIQSALASVTDHGLKNYYVYKIRIPDISLNIARDDYLVKGKHDDIVMTTVKDIQQFEHCKIADINYNTFGGLNHIRIEGV